MKPLDQQLYLLTLKSKFFLRTLEQKNIKKPQYFQLKRLTEELNSLLENYQQSPENQAINLEKVIQILTNMHQAYMQMRINDDLALLNEKADLQVETSFLLKDLKKLQKPNNHETHSADNKHNPER